MGYPARSFLGSLQRLDFKSTLGTITLVASTTGIRSIIFLDKINEGIEKELGSIPFAKKPGSILLTTKKQLLEYFKGERIKFSLTLDLKGTTFQIKAWNQMRLIPYGTTISYSDQATFLGDAKKARAVGMANSLNPIPIVIPCHRVIGKNGSLTGFSSGLDIKKKLLELEGWS